MFYVIIIPCILKRWDKINELTLLVNGLEIKNNELNKTIEKLSTECDKKRNLCKTNLHKDIIQNVCLDGAIRSMLVKQISGEMYMELSGPINRFIKDYLELNDLKVQPNNYSETNKIK
jgi:hypothetical protein